MTTHAGHDLWRRLCEAGLAAGDPPPSSESSSPWYVRAMLGVAGWLGAMFLLGFVAAGLALVFRNEAVAIVVGGACCAAAFLIFRSWGRNDLASQFALAVSIAGQVMVAIGLHEGFNDGAPFFLVLAVFEAILAFYIDNFVHRVLSSAAACFAFGTALETLGLHGLGQGVLAFALPALWLGEHAWAARGSLWRAVGYGLAFSLIQPEPALLTSGISSWRPHGFFSDQFWVPWLAPTLVGAALIYVVHRLLARYDVHPSSKAWNVAMVASVAVGVATFKAPGVTSSLIIILLGFSGGNRTLLGLGVLAMLSYLSYFYYSLQTTLLMKSMALGATGLTLVVLWAVMRSLFADSSARESAHA